MPRCISGTPKRARLNASNRVSETLYFPLGGRLSANDNSGYVWGVESPRANLAGPPFIQTLTRPPESTETVCMW
jgi:hypothetical protein